jgi:hypothetical protein
MGGALERLCLELGQGAVGQQSGAVWANDMRLRRFTLQFAISARCRPPSEWMRGISRQAPEGRTGVKCFTEALQRLRPC